VRLTIAEQRYWGGNIVVGDLHVVRDYVCASSMCRAIGPVALLPDSFLNSWDRDLAGSSYREIERRTGIGRAGADETHHVVGGRPVVADEDRYRGTRTSVKRRTTSGGSFWTPRRRQARNQTLSSEMVRLFFQDFLKIGFFTHAGARVDVDGFVFAVDHTRVHQIHEPEPGETK
jgi:hypothetical protein